MAIGTDGTGDLRDHHAQRHQSTVGDDASQKVGDVHGDLPGAGKLRARTRAILIGPGGANDDSWYSARASATAPALVADEAGPGRLHGLNQTVYPGGTVGIECLQWVKITGQARAISRRLGRARRAAHADF